MSKWKDEIVEYPNRYTIKNKGGDTVEITKEPGIIYQNETPINSENLNKTQDRIDKAWGNNPNVDQRVQWVDHEVQYPHRYKLTNNSDGTVTIIPDKVVIKQGTPVNAINLNKMENRIDYMINIPSDATATSSQIAQGYTAYVGQMQKITGSMKNNSGISKVLRRQGERYIIPEGYQDGKSEVTVNLPTVNVSKTLTQQNERYIIPEGYQDGTSDVVVRFTNLTSNNVKSGISIGGILGTYRGDTVTKFEEKTLYYDTPVTINTDFKIRVIMITDDRSTTPYLYSDGVLITTDINNNDENYNVKITDNSITFNHVTGSSQRKTYFIIIGTP